MINKINFELIFKYLMLFIIIAGFSVWRLKVAFQSVEYYELEGEIYYKTISIGVYSGGIVEALPVKEGTVLKQGELLAQLRNDILLSKIKGYEDNIYEGIPYNRTDYYEQLERVKGLTISMPVDGYILEVNTSLNGYVKDSDVIATVVPLDSIKYSVVINNDFKNKSSLELQEQFKLGQQVKIRNKLSSSIIDGTITDTAPFIEQDSPTDIKTRLMITPSTAQNMENTLGQHIEVLFVKKTMITRVADSINSTINFIKARLSK